MLLPFTVGIVAIAVVVSLYALLVVWSIKHPMGIRNICIGAAVVIALTLLIRGCTELGIQILTIYHRYYR